MKRHSPPPAISFRQLPLIVRLTAMIAIFLAWVLFAELIIDRHGLDRYLPLYRVGNLCPYDIAVIVALALCWHRLHRR
ncbi:MAG TPA: hypothetical protein VFZ91_09260 [Allosphingosinicella sp.]